MHLLRSLIYCSLMLTSLAACAHHRHPAAAASYEGPVVERRASPCKGGVWVERHRLRDGRWRESYWRCPGVRVIDPD